MQTIFFDIETGALPEAELAAMLPLFDPAEVKTGNLKDPAKIAEKLREAEEAHRREFFEKAALDPLTGRVITIGLLYKAEVRSQKSEFRLLAHEDEAATLREFWIATRGENGRVNAMVGFNTHLFDLPFLIRRSWRHRVSVPFGIRRGRYWGDEMIDLREAWQLGDRQARGSLDSIAKHLGVGAKCVPHLPTAAPVATGPVSNKMYPAGAPDAAPEAGALPKTRLVTGADFAELWRNDRKQAEAYLRNDLELTAKIAHALGIVG